MIRISHVSKSFRLRPTGGQSPRERLMHAILSVVRARRHVALRDISMEISPGDSVALMGVNGCGKTTLLKIVCGIMKPTSGSVEVTGRAGGLVELGAGFHDDLTGIENIFLHATLVGMPRREIRRRLDAILDFAELGRFIHTPVRHYSMGMFLRLGFAIAMNTDIDILVVDEALAVGDGYFQWKCLRKIKELKAQGKTLLFVSHLPDVAESVCRKAAWIHEGVVKSFGPSNEVARAYNQFVLNKMYEGGPQPWTPELSALLPQVRVGTGEIVIRGIRLLAADGETRHAFDRGEPVTIEVAAECFKPLDDVCIGYQVECIDTVATKVLSSERNAVFTVQPGKCRFLIRFPQLRLHAGTYHLTVSLYAARSLNALYDCHIKMHTITVNERQPWGYSTRVLDLAPSVSWEPGAGE
jgi:ABC-type polysaccharide/polyol phosphate transport system ATPase subunit